MAEIPNSMNMIQEEREIDRSREHDTIQEKIWEIDKQAQQAKDNIKRIVELENNQHELALKFSGWILSDVNFIDGDNIERAYMYDGDIKTSEELLQIFISLKSNTTTEIELPF